MKVQEIQQDTSTEEVVQIKKKKKNVTLILGSILIIIPLIIAVVSLFWMPHNPESMNTSLTFEAPNEIFWLGTDQFGRDILSRLMYSARSALTVGLFSVTLGSAVGILIGSLAAFAGPKIQQLLMRMIDALMAFPGILLALMLVTIMGEGLVNALIAIAIFMIPTYARLTFTLVSDQKNKLYIKAARTYGISFPRILFKHVFPAILPQLVTTYTSSLGGAILLESSLSFLGVGVQPPSSSWGLMLSEARQFMLTNPYLSIPPGIMLIITVLAFNLIGDGLNDFLVSKGEKN